MISEGRNINVTLIFSLTRYAEVIEAYLSGLEALAGSGRRPVAGPQRGVVLREPGRHRGGPPAGRRSASQAAGPGRARPPWPRPSWPTSCSSSASPGPGGRPWPPGRPSAAAPVGVDVDQEPGLPRPALRRQPDRPAHGQHHARRHRGRLPGPRHGGPHRRRRRRRRPQADLDAPGRRPASTWPTCPRVLEEEGVASFAKSYEELLQALHRQGQRRRHG